MVFIMECWTITEAGLTGTENQALGVARALGCEPITKRIGLRQPWETLSPFLGFETATTFTGDTLTAPWPDLVIAGGRKAIAAARYIKKQSGGKTFIVFLQTPVARIMDFDLVAIPAHDNVTGKNVIVTKGTPNGVTQAGLQKARERFAPVLSALPQPRVAVLIGGNSKTHKLTHDVMERLCLQLKDLAANGFGLMVTASRRTGSENHALLKAVLAGTNAHVWDFKSENPYGGYLAWADYIIVTNDSASMISEAATTGKPVYMVSLAGGSPKFDRLHNSLIESGHIRRFQGTLESYSYIPLSDAALVADEIKRRMNLSLPG